MPAEVKHVLDQKPSLISPIVQAFYERDPADMKVCRYSADSLACHTLSFLPKDVYFADLHVDCLYVSLQEQEKFFVNLTLLPLLG